MTTLHLAIRDALDAPVDPESLDRLTTFIGTLAAQPIAASSADLADVFDLSAGNNSRDSMPAQNSRGRRRPRTLAPLLAAAAVVAVTAGTFAVFAPGQSTNHAAGNQAAVGAGQSLRWALRVHPVAGLAFSRSSTSLIRDGRGSGQPAKLTSTLTFAPSAGGRASGRITYTADQAIQRPADLRQERITVDGVTYLYIPAGPIIGAKTSGITTAWGQANNSTPAELIWSTPDGGSGEIQSTFGFNPKTRRYDRSTTVKVMISVARAAVVGTSDSVTAPFALRSLDSRLWPNLVELNTKIGMQTYGLAFARSCIGYTSGERSGGLDGSYLVFCRFPTQPDPRANTKGCGQLREASGPADIHGIFAIRTLADGTSLCGLVDPANNYTHITQTILQRYLDQADTSPKTQKPSTWMPVM